MKHPEVLQFFNDEVYLMRISVQKSWIKVAIYEIYGMKWGSHGPLPLPLLRRLWFQQIVTSNI